MSTDNQGRGRQSDLAVMDINEFKQKRRLQRILDTHDQVEDLASRARAKYVAGEISHLGRDIRTFNAVRRYIREVYNLLFKSAHGLDNITYNEVTGRDEVIGRIEFEQRDDQIFESLQDYYQSDELYYETIIEQTQERHGPDTVEEHVEQHAVPVEASWRAYVLVNLFLGQKQGIEIQMEELEVDEEADPF